MKKLLEVKALKVENSQLQKLKSNFDKELRNKLSEGLKEKTNSIKLLEEKRRNQIASDSTIETCC